MCNLNQFRRSSINYFHPDLSNVLREVYYTDPTNPAERESCNSRVANFSTVANLTSLTLQDVSLFGSDPIQEFILFCQFAGRVCNASDFTPVFTKLGLCYTFNAGGDELRVAESSQELVVALVCL